MNKFILNKNTAIGAAADFIAIVFGFLFSILLVGSVGPEGTYQVFFTWFPLTALIATVFEFALFFLLKMFDSEWKALNIGEIIKLGAATVISFVLTYLFAFICGFEIAVSVYVVSLIITICLMLCARYILSVVSGQTVFSFSVGHQGSDEQEDSEPEKDGLSYPLPDDAVESLLGKEPVDPKIEKVIAVLAGKTVLVTGGAGTVGKELCRQIAAYSPKRLILLDMNESSANSVGTALKSQFPKLVLDAVVGNVCDAEKTDAIFEKYRPEIVFHAAAYNHTQLMEENPDEAIKNNVFGTLNAAQAADKFGAEKFMLLSTEKAVRPISIVGISKHLCENVVRLYASHSSTVFSAVRFGNVLGSYRNVVSIFQKQISDGGPVTVTSREATRYIISSSDAASMILRAFTVAETGVIYAIFNGDPVNIYDLAIKMADLAGYTPDVDISFQITGLRPNEKQTEELTFGEPAATADPMVFADTSEPLDEQSFLKTLAALKSAKGDEIKSIAASTVDSYVAE